MNEQLLQLLQNPEFAKKLAACANQEEAQALLQAQGLAIRPEELRAALDQLAPADGELNEDELDNVAGGTEGELTEVHDMLNSMVEHASEALDAAERAFLENDRLRKKKQEEDIAKGMADAMSHKSPDLSINLLH